MLASVRGVVARITAVRRGACELHVAAGGVERQAIAYTDLVGDVAVGDTVVLNTWAVEMGLGTGGLDMVMAVDRKERVSEPPGHIMKLRYTPLQMPVLSAESEESPYHAALEQFADLSGVPVVCAELHSQLPAIAAAARLEIGPEARIAYVMTDGSALPLGLSRLVPQLLDCGLLDTTITAGQAFGGEYEAVSLYSALAVAVVVARADVVIVSQGPGNAGTGTRLGFSGIDQAIALNAAAGLCATPIAAVRMSFADPRARHAGMSHHTRTVLGIGAMSRCVVPLPRTSEYEHANLARAVQLDHLDQKHDIVWVQAESGLSALLQSGVEVTTMGRRIDEERSFFLAAAAAGLVAGQCHCAKSFVERI